MARYAQGYKGPMTTAGPARPVNKAAPVSGPQPFPAPAPVKPAPTTAGNSPVPVIPPSRTLSGPLGSPGPAPASMGGGKPTPMPGITSLPPLPFSTPAPVRTNTGGGKPFSGIASALSGLASSAAGNTGPRPISPQMMKKGGQVKAKKVSSASKRADGIATKGKTRGKMV